MNTNSNPEETSKYPTVLLSLLAGAGAGLAVGLLMAPKAGASLRADSRGAIDDQLDTARNKAGDLKNSAVNLTQRGIREMQRTRDTVTQRAKNAVNSAVDSGSRQAHEAVDEASDAASSAAKNTHEAIDGAARAIRSESAA